MEKTNHDLQLQSRENVPARRQNDGYLRVYQSVFMFVLTLNLESKLRPGKLKVHTHTHKKQAHRDACTSGGNSFNIPGSSKPYAG